MEGHSLEALTIGIITYERHHYLERALDYYAAFGVNVVVADSSKEYFKKKLPQHITYLHVPEMEYFQKIRHLLTQVTTTFIIYLPDDDYVTHQGMTTCYRYMEHHTECVVAKGQNIAFSVEQGQIKFTLKNSYQYLLWQELGFIKERLSRVKKILQPYSQLVYCLHRTDVLRDFYSLDFSWLKSVGFFERTLNIYMAIRGEVAYLNTFFGAREVGNSRQHEGYNYSLHHEVLHSEKKEDQEEVAAMKRLLTNELLQHENIAKEAATSIITESLEAFCQHTMNRDPNLPRSLEEVRQAKKSANHWKARWMKPYVVGNDRFGRPFEHQKLQFPVYEKRYREALKRIYRSIKKYKHIYG